MSFNELEKATLQTLVDLIPPKLRGVVDELILKGCPVPDVRRLLVHTVRTVAGREHTLTELGIQEYLDRVELGKIKPGSPAKDDEVLVVTEHCDGR